MRTVHVVPQHDPRAWRELWALYRQALRAEWAPRAGPQLDEHLAACEAFVEPFFHELMAPIKLQADDLTLASLDALPAAQAAPVAEDVARFLRQLTTSWGQAQGQRVQLALARLADQFMAARVRS